MGCNGGRVYVESPPRQLTTQEDLGALPSRDRLPSGLRNYLIIRAGDVNQPH